MNLQKIVVLVLCLCGCLHGGQAQNVPGYVPTNGLVAWWPFNGNANDESGNGNNGTVNGATFTNDRLGNINNAYNFDGNDFIQVVNPNLISSISNASSLSISFWATDIGNLSPRSVLSSYQSPSGGIYLVNGFYGNSEIGVAILPTGSVFNTQITNPQQFHHFVISFDGNLSPANERLKVFIDGIQANISYPYAVPSQLGGGAVNFLIGARQSISNTPIDFWFGKIDDIGIWNRALTPQEITQLYQSCGPSISATVTPSSCFGGSNGAIQLNVSGDTASVSNPGLLISEIHTDPPLGDSNYEWVELIATDNINFAQKPYTVFFSNNGTATSRGWVEGQIPTPPTRNSTYAFLINSGSVSPGDVVYVGGSLMEPSGIKLRVKSTATEPGDGGIGGAFNGSAGVLGNGGGVADGVAVFNKHVSLIDSNTIPVDAIFYGTGIGGAAMADTTKGFTLPVNDRYVGGKLKTSSFLAPEILTFYSIKATGTYNRSTGIYTSPRTWTTNTSAWTSSTSDISLTGNTYLWSNGATTKNISNLASGTYTVTVTTSACSATFSYTVPQASQIQVATTSTAASCQTATNGSIASSVSGGVSPYSYQWSNGAASSGISALSPGNYTLTVTDANGCTAISTVSVVAGNNLPQIALTPSPAVCNGASNGVIASSIIGGELPYSSSWSNGLTDTQISGLPAGTYSLTVTDSVGCSASQSAIIQQLPPIVLSSVLPPSNSSGFPIAIKGANLGGITQVQFGSTPSSTFSLSGDSIINAIVPTEATGSSITVIDSIGCQSSIGFNYITSNPELGVRLFVEGLYVGGGFMDLPLVNSGLSGNPQHADSVTISIATANPPHTIVYSAKSLLVSSGHASIRLPGWVVGNSYYIVLNLRNAVETWSKLPVGFNSENTYYNFSSEKGFPAVETQPVSDVKNFKVTANGRVITDGGSPVTARGFCWSTLPKPTISLPTKTVNGTDTGSFSGLVSGLNANTRYYIRAYSTNSVGTSYGQEIVFISGNYPTDVDGNFYDTVVIGSQVWMSENLKVSKYRNGDPITTNLSNDWEYTTEGAYAIYDNMSYNDSIYGKLYNWYAVADQRGLCPTGWHVPSESEWTSLKSFLGGDSVAGGPMKSVSVFWQSPNTGASNSSGFSGLPGGIRIVNSYLYKSMVGAWWSSTNFSPTAANHYVLDFNSTILVQSANPYSIGKSVRCLKDSPPTLTTISAANVNSTSATSGGNIDDSGGDSVSVRGVCWSTSPNPTVALSTKTSDGTGSGSFTSNITGLQPSTTYYVRAYATNGAGTGYGSEYTFTTLAQGQFTDIDGNIYDTVAIGTQVWMKQNLKVNRYRNGDSLNTISTMQWNFPCFGPNCGSFSIYNSSSINDSIFGKLYNYYAISDSRSLCPAGWHIPSIQDFFTLINYLDSSSLVLNYFSPLSGIAGGSLKSVETLSYGGYWNGNNVGATNTSGFSALPGGSCNGSPFNTSYGGINNSVNFWSGTQHTSYSAYSIYLDVTSSGVFWGYFDKYSGFSVRCLKD